MSDTLATSQTQFTTSSSAETTATPEDTTPQEPLRERYIPYSRNDVVRMCLEDGKLDASQAEAFQAFSEILAAHHHFTFHTLQERIKENFAPFNPDNSNKIQALSSEERHEKTEQLRADLELLLLQANYRVLPDEDLKAAFDEMSLIELRAEVDFEDFEQVTCYVRSEKSETVTFKRLFGLRKVEFEMDIFERVVLMISFKDKEHFEAQGDTSTPINFEPGKTYLYLFKDIPKYDLEFIFPNVKLSMTLKDRLLFGVPAVGGMIPLLIKAVPKLLIVLGLILFVTMGTDGLRFLGDRVSTDDIKNLAPVLLALFSIGTLFGGFAVKQYNAYKNKHINFQKRVVETLFFKSLATNTSVFQTLIDAAEEEESKEIILVYYHLLTAPTPLSPTVLDNNIETWMAEHFNAIIDFDVDETLKELEHIKAPIGEGGQEVALVSYNDQGECVIPSLAEAKQIIDYVWDNAYSYA